MRKLIITEKSSVAKDFADALDCKWLPERKTYLNKSEQTEIVYCVGHLFSLKEPELYDIKFKNWSTLPVIPKNFEYRINESVKPISKQVISLLQEYKNDTIIIATDADREGELIARECLLMAGITDRTKIFRFWESQALTKNVILSGLKNAKPLSEYDGLAESGFARQAADWLVGINFSRLMTNKIHKTISVGRVQTAILAEIARRDKKIREFTPETYCEFYAEFNGDKNLAGILLNTKDGGTRFSDSAVYSDLLNISGKNSVITANESDRKTIQPPQLYNLADLQKDAFKKYEFSPEKTLVIIQKLYEVHKCVSYPRTPSKVMGTKNAELVRTLYEQFSASYAKYNSLITCAEKITADNKRIFDDKKLEAHHALIPLNFIPVEANEEERKIYGMILNRFMCVVAPDYIYDEQTILAESEGYLFNLKGRKIIQNGWKEFCESDKEEESTEQDSPVLDVQNLRITNIVKKMKKTKAPKHYNDASILSFMENPKSEDEQNSLCGIGTQATRHTFIPKLKSRNYITSDGKNIEITETGREVLSKIYNSPLKDLTDAGKTTEWEEKLSSNPPEFLIQIKSYVKESVKAMQKGK